MNEVEVGRVDVTGQVSSEPAGNFGDRHCFGRPSVDVGVELRHQLDRLRPMQRTIVVRAGAGCGGGSRCAVEQLRILQVAVSNIESEAGHTPIDPAVDDIEEVGKNSRRPPVEVALKRRERPFGWRLSTSRCKRSRISRILEWPVNSRFRSCAASWTARSTGVLLRHVAEAAVAALEGDRHCGRRPIAVLGDDQIGLTGSLRLRLVHVLAMYEKYHIRVLFYGSAFT